MGGHRAHPIERDWYWLKDDYFMVWKGLDWNSVRRGRQVYTEVFAPCHALPKMTFNHFQSFMTKEEIKALAQSYEIVDSEPDKTGEYQPRPGKTTDFLPAPYPNQQAAAFANNGAAPPNLRTIAFGVEGGIDYIFSLLTGYKWDGEYLERPPWAPEVKPGQFWNPYFKGGVLAMPPPLSDGLLDYEDGTPCTTSQMAKDVCAFLRWCVEPEFDERRICYWKCAITWGLGTLMFMHYAQKNMGWRIYNRLTFRYWKKTT